MDFTRTSVLRTIVGFIFLASIAFVFMLGYKVQNFALFWQLKDFLPYIAIATIPVSYVLGFFAEIILKWLIRIVLKKKLENDINAESPNWIVVLQYGSPALVTAVQRTQAIENFVRLLFLAFFVWAIVFLWWICSSEYKSYWLLSFVWFFLSLACLMVYFSIRKGARHLLEEAYKLVNQQREK